MFKRLGQSRHTSLPQCAVGIQTVTMQRQVLGYGDSMVYDLATDVLEERRASCKHVNVGGSLVA